MDCKVFYEPYDYVSFGSHKLGLYNNDSDPYFSAGEVGRFIDYSIGTVGIMLDYVSDVDKVPILVESRIRVRKKEGVDFEEKLIIREKWFINGNGFLDILMQSSKQKAKEFRIILKQILKERREKIGLSFADDMAQLTRTTNPLLDDYFDKSSSKPDESLSSRRERAMTNADIAREQFRIMFERRVEPLDDYKVSDVADSVEIVSDLREQRYSAATLLKYQRGIVTIYYQACKNRFIDNDGVIVLDLSNYALPDEIVIFKSHMEPYMTTSPLDRSVTVEIKPLDESDEGFLDGFEEVWKEPLVPGGVPILQYEAV